MSQVSIDVLGSGEFVDLPMLKLSEAESKKLASLPRVPSPQRPPELSRGGRDPSQTRKGAEGRYRSLFENNIDAVFALDRNGRFTEANLAAERLIGFSQQELRGMLFADVCSVEDRHKAMFFFARAMSGTPRMIDIGGVCRDGSCLDLVISGSPIVVDEAVVGLFCIARDVTRKRRADEQLRRATREAEQAKDRFLAVISHELRTPLMPVLTTVQMLERMPDLTPEIHETLAMMRRNLELEAKLIDDLLDLNRIRQGKLTLCFQNVDLHAKVKHVLQLCAEEAEQKQLNIRLELEAEHFQMAADPARMQQILWNIMGNAVKFTPDGGTITVRTCNGGCEDSVCAGGCGRGKLSCRRMSASLRQGRFLLIHVTDTGIGISKEMLSKLFEAFGRGEKGPTSGRGIGLAITKALVELHGGQLLVHSRGRGRGSTFSVVLPVRAASNLPDRVRHGHRPLPTSSGKRVLLVEDHHDTARALGRLLSDSGLVVSIASTVQKAMQLASQAEFDLLISDIGLPDGTGMDVVRHVRRRCYIPAIALSGYGMEEDVKRSRDAGFSEHLVKPINITQLQQTIGHLLSDATNTHC